jgi:hypothetical protein
MIPGVKIPSPGRCAGLLAAVLVLVPAARARAADPPRLADLTPEVRQRLDGQARRSSAEPPAEKAVSLAGDFTAWLLSRTPLTPEEERDHARELHRALMAEFRTVPTPLAAERVFRRLLGALPPHLKPEVFSYALVVTDLPDVDAFSPGGGLVYVTRPLLDALLPGDRGEAALAFVLAHQLAHVALGHTRRGWQMVEAEDEIHNGVLPLVRPEMLRAALGTAARRTGRVVEFLYTHNQQREADLFAFHLCRNAGIPPDAALDALRWLALREQRGLARPQPLEALARLRLLLMERDGEVEDEEKYGLFAYDPRDDALAKAAAGSVAAGDRPIVLVHGLHGREQSFRDWLPFLAGQKELAGRRLLLFRYPNTESLARCGHFLHREMARVVAAPAEAVFIAHSAGGLVVRWYAEVQKGGLDRAVFLATPHGGSDLAALRVLLDLGEIAGRREGGLRARLAELVTEGAGAAAYDLQPDSLFLRRLGHDPERAARYHVFTGRYLSRPEGLALRSALLTIREVARHQVALRVEVPFLRTRALRRLDHLRVPEEVTDGDLAVSLASATLAGASRVTRTRLHHLAFLVSASVREQVLDSLLGR